MSILLKRWLTCCLLFFTACSDQQKINTLVIAKEDSLQTEAKAIRANKLIDSIAKSIQSGDLIVRTGNDFTSESLRGLNRKDKTYSHCGIASIEHDSIFVYHALGGEFNADQKIRRDALRLFAEPYGNKGIGIFRYHLSPGQVDSLIAVVRNYFNKGIMFDMKFDLATDDRMYCAEFVCKSYMHACKLHFNKSHLDTFTFIGVDDLFLHPQCAEIKRLLYK